jgi:hypothetical protein
MPSVKSETDHCPFTSTINSSSPGCSTRRRLWEAFQSSSPSAESGSEYGTGAVGVWEVFWKEVAGGAAFPSISELRQTALGRYRIWRNWVAVLWISATVPTG